MGVRVTLHTAWVSELHFILCFKEVRSKGYGLNETSTYRLVLLGDIYEYRNIGPSIYSVSLMAGFTSRVTRIPRERW